MKVGILGCFYGNADLLPQVLAPWEELKQTWKASGEHELVVAGINAQFKEYAEMAYPDEDSDTRALLFDRAGFFDSLDLSPAPLSEKEARDIPLQYLLDQKVDLVWMLDGDELYTKEQIGGILGYVRTTPEFDYYHLHLDNYIFGDTHWGDDFFPPRIFRTDRSGGVKGFTFDNELEYRDGSKLYDRTPGIVPKHIAHIRHETWRFADAEKKIAYQQRHFGYCMFRRSASGSFEMDPAYFAHHQMPLPQSLEGGTLYISKNPALDVVMRSHLGPNVHGGPRVTDTLGGKHELMIRTLRSLIRSLNRLYRRNDAAITLTVLDDHSTPELVVRFQELLAQAPFATKFVSLAESGNGKSLRACYDYAREHARGLIYFVEDDYLHEPSALEEMWDAHRIFTRHLGGRPCALFPIDYIHLYEPERIEQTRLVPGTRRHWRVVHESTCTFMVPREALIAHWPKFVELAENGVVESTSINAVWRDSVILFSPVPTLTYHMHYEALMPPFSNWRRLWDSLAPYAPTDH